MANNYQAKDGNGVLQTFKAKEVEGVKIMANASPLTAFGESDTSESTPKIQLQFPYNINTDIVNTDVTNSGTVTQSDSMAVVSSGTTTGSTALLESVDVLKYNAGQGGKVRFTALFETGGVAGTTQIAGYGDTTDGFSFGFDGATFGIFRYQNGNKNFTAQTAWNVDPFDGTGPSGQTLDTTKGNIFQIKFQYLGFGDIFYYVEDKATGEFQLVHIDKYAGSQTVPSIYNPSLPVSVFVDNGATTTDLVVKSASMFAAIEGKDEEIGPINTTRNSTASSTNTNMITIRNKSTFASKTNRVRIKIILFTAATDGTQPVTFDIYRNQTITAPTYNDISTNTSVVDVDKVGTIGVIDGKDVTSIQLSKTDSDKFFLKDLDITVAPGETLTVVANGTNAGSAVSLTWRELF